MQREGWAGRGPGQRRRSLAAVSPGSEDPVTHGSTVGRARCPRWGRVPPSSLPPSPAFPQVLADPTAAPPTATETPSLSSPAGHGCHCLPRPSSAVHCPEHTAAGGSPACGHAQAHAAPRTAAELEDDSAAAGYGAGPGADRGGQESPAPRYRPAMALLGLCSWGRSPAPAPVPLLEDQKKEP